jgi:hypothetical protein
LSVYFSRPSATERAYDVIPTPERLQEIARLREGNLPQVPIAPLLLAHALEQHTLVLEVRRRQVWKRILLEQGVPVDCRSNLAHETLGRYMVLEGKLSEEDFTACLSRSAANGVPLGEVLLGQGLVTATVLFKLLQQNLAKKLLDLFTWTEGEFRWLDEPPASESSLKVKVPQLILTGLTRCAPQEEVDMAVGPLVGKKLALHPAPPFPLEELRLNPRQSRLAEALRPGRRMGELAELTELPVDEIARLLYAFCTLGVAAPVDSLPRDLLTETGSVRRPVLVPPPAEVSTQPVAVPPAEAVPQEVERRRDEIMQAYLSYRRQDSFDLLGAPEDGTPAVFAERFLDFARRFAPWSLAAPDLAEKARDLFLAGARAYSELADSEQRGTLLFRRKTLREERAKKPAASFAIKTDLLDSESQYKKGKALMDAGKVREALMLLEFAADCDPQNSLYAAELAYCRFLDTTAHGERALRELKEALRRDPNCGIAAFYAGEIHRQLGDREEAEAHLRRAIKLMSPDRRPIEALKLLSSEKRH